MKCSENAYMSEKVTVWWWCDLLTGASAMYLRVSFIHPMFHLSPNPSPPSEVGAGERQATRWTPRRS